MIILTKQMEEKSEWKLLQIFQPIIEKMVVDFRNRRQEINLTIAWDTIEKDWIRYALDEIFSLACRVLVIELHAHRSLQLLEGDTPEERYTYFCNQLANPTIAKALLEDYPFLVQQVKTRIMHVLNAVFECLHRLQHDMSSIEVYFEQSFGMLEQIQPGCSDSHNHGKTVFILKFYGGDLVYKPRSGMVDLHFQGFLKLLNSFISHSFKTIRILSNSTYHWAEYISGEELTKPEDDKLYAYRFGGMLGILYLLQGTDFHYENIIAHGDQPVIVDGETLFHPHTQKKNLVDSTVYRVGLLRMDSLDSEDQLIVTNVPYWKDKGKDTMHIGRKDKTFNLEKSLPRWNGKVVSMRKKIDFIMKGFEETLQVIVQQKNDFHSYLSTFKGDPIRIIFRSTQAYSMLLEELSNPLVIREENERIKLLQKLKEALPHLHALVPYEIKSILDGDIPYFFGYPSSRNVHSTEKVTSYQLEETPLQRSYHLLHNLDESIIHKQLGYIQLAFEKRFSPNKFPQIYEGKQNKLLKMANYIGEQIMEYYSSYYHDKQWIDQDYDLNGDWKLSILGYDLYKGRSGIALYFCFLSMLMRKSNFEEFARKLLEGDPSFSTIGAFNGWGGWIYTLSQCSQVWNDLSLRKQAKQISTQIKHMIHKDQTLDVIDGTAGLTLSLKSLSNEVDAMEELEILFACGEHLFQSISLDKKMKTLHTGIAHGNSGIALALFHLGELFNQRHWLKAAKLLIAEENIFFVSDYNNWWDNRSQPYQMTHQWCVGAPGIGLSRISMFESTKDASILHDIEAAWYSTLRHSWGSNHSLCHGDFGNMDFLLEAAPIMDPTKKTINVITSQVCDRLERVGCICGTPNEVPITGLMTGLSGIGYGLLRLYEPDWIPSVNRLASYQNRC
ncbi:type 2 lantipeptide synthetase LanM family protein [Hazenella sp. IB182357]|uniref:Type 2 lantipeptide synthetase LanM family protein n=1 Tax=Polycladospora coralii TaxID=2771432 RepID=A0A926NCR9_9BACL|nr:type 2 lanthipeptide synthetase LanM family protein [Polycladospora coralii]MBD1373857.1 type 2 lantipeptide synthetase LanM family protein [Polycladospora coralii]